MATLIKTDRNGTQYWEDYVCPKCDGKGKIYYYYHVKGGICFLCNGTGSYRTHWRTYTPEYEAKLEARRAEKRQRKVDEFNANISEHYKELGLNADGRCFAVLDRTFGRTDELKAAGARFNGDWWYFDHSVDGWDLLEVDAKDLIRVDAYEGRIEWNEDKKGFEIKSVVEKVLKERRVEENISIGSEFYGSEGDKVNTEVVLDKVFSFGSWDYRGNECTMYGYKMSDSSGHHFVWMTGCNPWGILGYVNGDDFYKWENVEKFYGKEFSLRGTVKGHSEYQGLKETKLNRCKIAIKEA